MSGYTGHEHDLKYGLINMRGRMYDPEIGRFLTPDPVLQQPFYSAGLNPYSYVFNSPANLIDPTGFVPVTEKGTPDDPIIVTGTRPSPTYGDDPTGGGNGDGAGGAAETEGTDQTAASSASSNGQPSGSGSQSGNDRKPGGSGPNVETGRKKKARLDAGVKCFNTGCVFDDPGAMQSSLLDEVSSQPQFRNWEEYGRELQTLPYDVALNLLDAPGMLALGTLKVVGKETAEYIAREAAERATLRAVKVGGKAQRWWPRISAVASDWGTKGAHLHIDGIELAARPTHTGSIVFTPVFSGQNARAVQAAIAPATKALGDVGFRQRLFNASSRAIQVVEGGKGAELRFLMHALEKMGL
jgi:RHS repeat-associated protein